MHRVRRNRKRPNGLTLLPLTVVLMLAFCGCVRCPTKLAVSATVTRGDRLLIVFTNRQVPAYHCVVDPNGEVEMLLRVKLRVAGMTLVQVEQAIQNRYVQCYAEPLQVSVSKGRQPTVKSELKPHSQAN